MDGLMDMVCGFFNVNLLREGFSDTLREGVLREEEVVGQLIDIHASPRKLVHALICTYGTSQVAPSPC